MTKEEEIKLVSNPTEVRKKANEVFDGNFLLRLSTRKDKKYMIKSPYTRDKWVHFGSMDYQDYTKHKDKERRRKFLIRNHKWKTMPTYTPAFLSYYLLW